MNDRPKIVHTWALIDEDGCIHVRSFATAEEALNDAKKWFEERDIPTGNAQSGSDLASAWEAFAPGSGEFFLAKNLLSGADRCEEASALEEASMSLLPAIICFPGKAR
jgi:hypothetical protein